MSKIRLLDEKRAVVGDVVGPDQAHWPKVVHHGERAFVFEREELINPDEVAPEKREARGVYVEAPTVQLKPAS